jgi:YVTN family beta-propeller protein
LDEAHGRLYVAVYNRNQIWVYDPSGTEVLAEIEAGKGPVALALSADGNTLACVNRLDNTVSLLDTENVTVTSTVQVGASPAAIAPMPGNRFAVVNTFSDSVSIVDTESHSADFAPGRIPAVPTDIATAGNSTAIIGRVDQSIFLYPQGAFQSPTEVSIEAAPLAIVGGDDGTFFARTANKLFALDATSGAVHAVRELAASDISVDNNHLYALHGDQITRFDNTLQEVERWTLGAPASQIYVRAEVFVALQPRDPAWQVWNAATLQAQALPPRPEPVEEQAPAGPSDTPVTVEIIEAESVETAAEETPARVAETEPIPTTEPEIPDAPTRPLLQSFPKTLLKAKTQRNKNPLGSPMRKLFDSGPQKRADEEDTPQGFHAIDFDQEPRFSADVSDIALTSNMFEASDEDMSMEGNVRVQIEDADWQGDIRYDSQRSTYFADNGVTVTQGPATFTADTAHYGVPPLTEAPVLPMLVPSGDDPEDHIPHRMAQGRLEASNVHIIEPTRELTAELMDFDFSAATGDFSAARGNEGKYFYAAEKLRVLGPGDLEGDHIWVTTCDRDPPHYKVRMRKAELKGKSIVKASHSRLQIRRLPLPLYVPRLSGNIDEFGSLSGDFDSGTQSELGSFLNISRQFELKPGIAMGPRLFATTEQGVGLGADLNYDLMNDPASRLYRNKGSLSGLYTTQERGYIDWDHRYEYNDDLVLRISAEQWSTRDFFKDFYFDEYDDRTTPRTFANLTYRRPTHITTGTVRVNTHNFVDETERLPEASFHLLERPLGKDFYLSFDTITGYNRRDYDGTGTEAGRNINVARLTYNWDPARGFSITPFAELYGAYYTEERDGGGSVGRASGTIGTTVQTRFQKAIAGRGPFSGFKHIVVPSVTAFYRSPATEDFDRVARFDALDNVLERSRIESKLDNIVYGRDAETGQVWQVLRLTFYQGNDITNEVSRAQDYEVEMDFRPRPTWGLFLSGERHISSEDDDFSDIPVADLRAFGSPRSGFAGYVGRGSDIDFRSLSGDYSRFFTQLYVNDLGKHDALDGRIGFSFTRSQQEVIERDFIYGLDYNLGRKWGIGFEHRYDFTDGGLRAQTYEIRRSWHDWNTAFRIRDRESGLDFGFEIQLKTTPGWRPKG